jgi:glutathione peroxidase
MDSSDATKTFFDLTAKNIDGQVVNLSGYRGKKAILVVNVASKCGLTNDNYKQLVSIYSEYS